ncbi:unnamed protein product [Symbiodinium natans]|uniref:Uncharacterized protein n=1 Tax=Symbiodinium natans TaxID=878477 RepID=A0A812IGL6_9DINO|nr:unnamed protein product [Symbiodinium natans]
MSVQGPAKAGMENSGYSAPSSAVAPPGRGQAARRSRRWCTGRRSHPGRCSEQAPHLWPACARRGRVLPLRPWPFASLLQPCLPQSRSHQPFLS